MMTHLPSQQTFQPTQEAHVARPAKKIEAKQIFLFPIVLGTDEPSLSLNDAILGPDLPVRPRLNHTLGRENATE
jgi:hypothetical protein